MILQQLVWNNEKMQHTTELYYHADAEIRVSDAGMQIPAGSRVQFDTYFNSFLAKNWNRYTNVKQIIVRCVLQGEGIVRLLGNKEDAVAEQKFSGKQEVIFEQKIFESPYFYLEIEAEKESVLESGSIETDMAQQPVKLALATCTYNRKQDIKKNIELLKQYNSAASTEEAVLEQIYVVDNASNLTKEEIEGDRVCLIPNKNTGGAGGFTRGLQEALKKEDVTHIILMDDDVHIEFEAFRRTKAFLSYIKEEYKENFLGGAMFRTDMPYVLHAAGEDWSDGHIRNVYKSTDMRKFPQVLAVSEPVETEQAYAAWWCCCIPRSHVEKRGYPMPFFLHCDDVEYGLRSGRPPMYLNGIAVWHEEFEDKRSSVVEYYDVRNRLITNALYKKKGKKRDVICVLCERFCATVLRYRYKDFSLSVKAVEDFLKGPDWLAKVDSEALHKTLSSYGYRWNEVQELPEEADYPTGKKLSAILKYFLPAKGRRVIRMGAPVSAYAGKKQVLLVEPKSGKGFTVRKSFRETMRCGGRLIVEVWKVLWGYRNIEKQWKKR